MVDGTDDTDTAASRLHQVIAHCLEHPVTGPVEGHPASRSAPAPLSLATLDHIQSSRREVIEHTRNANPEAGPAPSRPDAVYDWAREHTEHTDEQTQQRRDTIEYRQYLEHSLRAGDKLVIRRQRCPECRTWGLMWQRNMQTVLCTNTDCVDSDGFSTTVTLARLAYEHIAARKNLRQARAT